MKFNIRQYGIGALLFVVFMVGGLIGWMVRDADLSGSAEQKVQKEIHEGQNDLINPLLTCSESRDLSGELVPFRDRIDKVVHEKTERKEARMVSVYFRDLNNGPWFGIDEGEKFSPASLLKVPILMGWLKAAESSPEVLSRSIKYENMIGEYDQLETIRPAVQAEVGKTYTADELLYLMIVYSDNNAAMILSNRGWAYSEKVYRAMGLPQPNLQGGDYQMSLVSYASFFRMLFNASYLNAGMSNKALDMLASSDFRRGLVGGVPEKVVVAHKFGERVMAAEKQFHDCGIVYYPNKPYLLCVMTRGSDMDKLIATVEDISRIAYEEVDLQIRGKGR